MTKYLQQAKDFLAKNEITLTIKEAIPQTPPIWANPDKKGQDYGIKYWCNLFNRKTGQSYGFEFWNSVSAKNKNERPNAYDVLVCLDTYSDGDSFEDFCSVYGYDTDSIMAEKTYKAVMKQIDGLKQVFTAEQLSELNKIS